MKGNAHHFEEVGHLVNTLQGGFLGDVHVLFEVGAIGDRTDEELIDCFTAGEGDTAQLAFMGLVGRHGPMVLRVCRRILGDPHEAEDAFQAVFLVLARKASCLRVRNSLGPWLHRVACNVASCARSTAALRRRHERRHAEATAFAVEESHWDDVGLVLHEEVDRLPERYRVPIVLCYLEDLTHEQAARRLNWPVGTVRTRLARGRARLRARLIRRGLATAGGLTLIPDAVSAAVPEALVRSTVLAGVAYAAGGAASGAVSKAVAILAKRALSAMTPSRLRLVASFAFGAVVVACGLTAVVALAQARGPRETSRAVAASAPVRLQTPTAGSATKQPVIAAYFHDPDRKRHDFDGYSPNPYQVNGLLNSSPPGALTIHLGPVRFEDLRLHSEKWMPLIDRQTIVAVTNAERDRISAYSTKRGGWHTYRVPDGVKFTPDANDDAMALYLAGESIPEVVVFSARQGAWNKQVLKVPAKGKLEPLITPQIVLYGAGRWVYAYSTETNTWDTLELAADKQVLARLSGANVLVEDTHNHRLSIFAPGIGRWDTIETTAISD